MKALTLLFLLASAPAEAGTQRCTTTTSATGTVRTECYNPRMTCTSTRSATGTVRTECRRG